MKGKVSYLDAKAAREICTEILKGAGALPVQAELVADNLVKADLRGIASHGVSRMAVYMQRIKNGMTNLAPDFRTISETGSTLLIDADNALGAAAGVYAMDKAIEKAAISGMASCAVRRGNHFGIAAYYAMRALPRDMIGMSFTNAPPTMAPWGGITPMLGTNPICFAIPAAACQPIVLDAATSVVARGKINLAEIEGHDIPDNWALDTKGRPTVNATEALKGTVLPFGTYKGSGISMIVDIFCGLLSGAAYGSHIGMLYDNSMEEQNIGYFFCALDIKAFADPAAFKANMDTMIHELKNGSKAEGADAIFMPGEIEFNNEKFFLEHGIEAGPGVLRDLSELCRRYGVGIDPYEFVTST